MRTKATYAVSARLGDAADEVARQNVREELRGRRDRGPAAGSISFARPARWVAFRGLAGALGQPDGSPSGASLRPHEVLGHEERAVTGGRDPGTHLGVGPVQDVLPVLRRLQERPRHGAAGG